MYLSNKEVTIATSHLGVSYVQHLLEREEREGGREGEGGEREREREREGGRGREGERE